MAFSGGRRKWIFWPGLFIVILCGMAFFRRGEKERYVTERVEQGSITAVVSATGKVNAVVTVQVGSQVSGTLQRLFVDFNSPVRKGQIIAQIDPTVFSAQVEQAMAKRASDEADVEKAQVVLD